MPGEEQHFAIRVGSDDFSFSGLVLLAVPATLQQLDQIADLREAKEKVEDSYDAINDSMDVILNTLDLSLIHILQRRAHPHQRRPNPG